MNSYLKEQTDIIEYSPKLFAYKILTSIDKVLIEENIPKKEITNLEQIKQYNEFNILDLFDKALEISEQNKNPLILQKIFTEEEYSFIKQININYIEQIKDLYDLYKLHNFKSKDIDTYEIQQKSLDFINFYKTECTKKNNQINYEALKDNLTMNRLFYEWLETKINYFNFLQQINKQKSYNDVVYKYSEDDFLILEDINLLSKNEFSKELLRILTLSQKEDISNFTNNGFYFRNKLFINREFMKKDLDFKKESLKLNKIYSSKFLEFLTDFWKYNYQENIYIYNYMNTLNQCLEVYKQKNV